MTLQHLRSLFYSALLLIITNIANANSLPPNFVYLKDIDPSIVQDIRYASDHNIVGEPLKGYNAAECILTLQAAQKLTAIQKELKKSSLSLKVYDCYRPQMTVDEFKKWSLSSQQIMSDEFFPREPKDTFFAKGYIAEKSGHTRGSTVDITLVPIPTPKQAHYQRGEKLITCFADYQTRYHDNSIDMGTGYDCLDELSHPTNRNISATAYNNRMLLRDIMFKYGFKGIPTEWWHFTLSDEPYPDTYFNFPIQKNSH